MSQTMRGAERRGMSIVIKSSASWFDQMLGDISYEPDSTAGRIYPFFVRVGCVKRRPPRHEFFEMVLDFGYALIDKVMYHEKIDQKQLAFVFPERWLGVAEQQAFTHVLSKHPEAKLIDQVDIITSSPMIIGGFRSEQIRVLTWPDDEGLFDGSPDNR